MCDILVHAYNIDHITTKSAGKDTMLLQGMA